MTDKERHLATLARALELSFTSAYSEFLATQRYAELRAVVRAVIPGLQTKANIADAMDAAVRAVSRVIRRRAR